MNYWKLTPITHQNIIYTTIDQILRFEPEKTKNEASIILAKKFKIQQESYNTINPKQCKP